MCIFLFFMHVCLFHGCAWLAIFVLTCFLRGLHIQGTYSAYGLCILSSLRPMLTQLCRCDRFHVSTLWPAVMCALDPLQLFSRPGDLSKL